MINPHVQRHHGACRATDSREIQETSEAWERAPKDVGGVGFVPWIGKRYDESAEFTNKAILILGESHYECSLLGAWHAP